MSRLYRRRDRIHDQVQITVVLAHYGYRVHPDNYEQQFPCDLHGDGMDIKPSGRVYPHSNSWYCFACDQTRDTISTVQAKENVSFAEAIKVLEERYGLPDLPWEDDDFQERKAKPEDEVQDHMGEVERGSTYETERHRVDILLYNLMQDPERAIPGDTVLALYEAYDRFAWSVEKEHTDHSVGREAMIKLRKRIMDKLEAPT